MKHVFWDADVKLPCAASPPFEDNEKYEGHHYISLFDDHPKEEGVLISPESILRMRMERGELPWPRLGSNQRDNPTKLSILGAWRFWGSLRSPRCWIRPRWRWLLLARALLSDQVAPRLGGALSWWSSETHTFDSSSSIRRVECH